MSLWSHDWVEITLNGHTVTGFSDDNPPWMFDQESSATFKTPADGGRFGLSLPNLGGILTIKLRPDSPSASYFCQREAERKERIINRRRPQIFQGSIVDTVNNHHWTLVNVAIEKLPAVCVADLTYEAILNVERMIENIEGSSGFVSRFAEPGGQLKGDLRWTKWGGSLPDRYRRSDRTNFKIQSSNSENRSFE